jgi:hypothetical protein
MTSPLEGSLEELMITSERLTVLPVAELVSPGVLLRVSAEVQEVAV